MGGHQRKHSPRRTLGVLAGSVLVGVVSAACSSPSATSPVASLPGQGGSTTTTPVLSESAQKARSDQAMVDFARCMRAHGVNVPDPAHVAGHSGLTLQVPAQTASTAAAYNACNHFIAALEKGKGGPGGPSISAADLAARTNYARCMRSHDIDMLDPDRYGNLNLGNVPGINNDFGRYSPQFRVADSACRHLLPAGVHDDGSGP